MAMFWAVGRWLMAFLDDEILLSVSCAKYHRYLLTNERRVSRLH